MAKLSKSTGKKIQELIKEHQSSDRIASDYWADAEKCVENSVDEHLTRQQSNYWEVRSINALIELWEEYNINLSYEDKIEALKERKEHRQRYDEVLDKQIEMAQERESKEMIEAVRGMEAVA